MNVSCLFFFSLFYVCLIIPLLFLRISYIHYNTFILLWIKRLFTKVYYYKRVRWKNEKTISVNFHDDVHVAFTFACQDSYSKSKTLKNLFSLDFSFPISPLFFYEFLIQKILISHFLFHNFLPFLFLHCFFNGHCII